MFFLLLFFTVGENLSFSVLVLYQKVTGHVFVKNCFGKINFVYRKVYAKLS
jgi:hypothetical protein